MRAGLSLTAALLAALAVMPRAHADAPTAAAVAPLTPVPADPPPVTDHFGGEILGADLAALALGFAGTYATEQPVFFLAYLGAAPLVHSLHGDYTGAAVSFSLHLFTPVAGAFIGYQIESANCQPGQWFCGLGGLALGTLVGVVVASSVDAIFLGAHERPAQRRAVRSLPMPTIAIAPQGGLMLGLAGRL